MELTSVVSCYQRRTNGRITMALTIGGGILLAVFIILVATNKSHGASYFIEKDTNSSINEIHTKSSSSRPTFAPYYDVTLKGLKLEKVYEQTGQLDYSLAFALGSNEGCVPKWGGTIDINDAAVLAPIKSMIEKGGRMIVSTGGAAGPYLESLCRTPEELSNAYKIVLDAVGTNHLDIDIEATVDMNNMNKALALLQKERPDVTVAFTLMVQGEEYGITPFLGVNLLQSAKENGVTVHTCNIMAMEYSKAIGSESWGKSIVNAGISTMKQMKEIWPEKTESELKQNLGITPMLGRNFNGNIFTPSDAKILLEYANKNSIGFLSFWSIGRDNGDCPSGGISPTCSSIAQEQFEFTKEFKKFKL